MLNKKKWVHPLLSLIYLLFFCNTVYASFDPKLVGVWDNFNVDRIYEFRSDGSWLGWTFKGSQGKKDFKYILIRDLKITMLSKNKFQITKTNTLADNRYQIPYSKDNKTIDISVKKYDFKIQELGKIREYSKRAFNYSDRGSYQQHLNFAFDARLRLAIKAKNVNQLQNLLSSSKADFLKGKNIKVKEKSGKMIIYSRLWRLAIKTKNTKLVSVLVKNFPNDNTEQFIELAKELKDKDMVALLNKANGINAKVANGATAASFKKLFQFDEWVDYPIEHQKNILKRNCVRANVRTSLERERYGKAVQDELGYWIMQKLELEKNNNSKQRNSNGAKSQIKVTTHAETFDSTLHSCLNNYQKKGERISQSLLDGTFNRGNRDTGTPLYSYANIGSLQTYSNGSWSETAIYSYTTIKTLLEFGANPDIKPKETIKSFAAYMYSRAPHKRFAYLEELNTILRKTKFPVPKIQYQADLIAAEIKLYNEIMEKIGGHPYQANDTSYQNKSTSTTLRSTKLQSSNKKIVTKRKTIIKTNIKPKIKTKPKPTKNIDALSGCWNWSNGAKIIITKNGQAKNGFIPAVWKTIDSKNYRYSITWPSITDTVVLSADGSIYSGKNIFGLPIFAKRISGKPNSIQGKWLNNNFELTLAANKTATVGPLKGTWKKHGNGYIIEWPIIDYITVAKNKNTLIGKNQFGSFTAKRNKNCGAK